LKICSKKISLNQSLGFWIMKVVLQRN